MINTKIHSKAYRYVLLTAAAVFVASAECAIAGGGGSSGDHGFKSHDFNEHGGTSHGFGSENDRLKPSNFQDQGRFGNKASKYFGSMNERLGNSGARATKQGNDVPVGTVARAPATASRNTIRPIITNGTVHDAVEGKLPANNPVGNTHPALGPNSSAANGTLHPNDPVGNTHPTLGSGSSTVVGKLPPNDPVGNTHPTPGSNPPTVVTVSNGVTSTQIQNGPGGVVVYSEKPGTITVDNGKEKTTLPGGSVTLSGNVIVGRSQGVEVGPRNGEGKTVVAIKPPAPAPVPPSHVTGGPDGGFFGGLGNSIEDGVKAVGNGVADGVVAVGKGIGDVVGDSGFKAGPVTTVPPPATSTIQQQ